LSSSSDEAVRIDGLLPGFGRLAKHIKQLPANLTMPFADGVIVKLVVVLPAKVEVDEFYIRKLLISADRIVAELVAVGVAVDHQHTLVAQ
jgi:hypothetical protein